MMKSNKMYILIGWLVVSAGLAAQANLSGRIIDTDSLPVANATVLLLKQTDSTYRTGTAADRDGRFEMVNIEPGNYILSFSIMGFKKIDTPLQVGKDTNSELGDIILEEDAYNLATVFVTGQRPAVKIEPGKMTIDLSSALLSTDGNILNALKKLPGILVQNDGTIILNGKSGAQVLIDGKLTYLSGENLMNYLRSIPAHSVENIELISQPSSRYDASGSSGMINIQKKRRKERGWNLGVSSGLEKGECTRGNESLSMNFRSDKWNWYAAYSYSFGKDAIDVSVSGHYLDPVTSKPLELRKDFDSDIHRQYGGHYIKTGVEYDVSEKIAAETYFSANRLGRKKNERTVSDFFNDDKTLSDSTLTALNTIDYTYTDLAGGAGIVYKFAKTGKWDAAFDYQLFDQEDDQLLESSFRAPDRPLNNDTLSGKAKNDIKIYSGQTDGTYEISEKFKIGSGLKTVFINIASQASYTDRIDGGWKENGELSSNFTYKENTNAGYFHLASKWSSHLSTEIGLRVENTNTKSHYRSTKQDTTFTKKYTHLFPTLTAQYQLSENQSVSLAYGRRIVRPNYRNMNPFVEVKDQFLYEQGNTELKPELIDNVEISWLLRKRYSFHVFYTHRKDPISLSFLVEDKSRVLIMPLNLSGNHSFGVRIGFNNLRPCKGWTASINGSVAYRRFDWMRSGNSFGHEVVTPLLHIINRFALPDGWGAEVIGFYSGEMIEGQIKVKPLWSIDLGLRKNFLKDKFSLYIYAHDIFHSNRPRVIMDTNYLYYTSKEKNDSRMVGISLGYRFNRGKEVKKAYRGNGIEESNRIDR